MHVSAGISARAIDLQVLYPTAYKEKILHVLDRWLKTCFETIGGPCRLPVSQHSVTVFPCMNCIMHSFAGFVSDEEQCNELILKLSSVVGATLQAVSYQKQTTIFTSAPAEGLKSHHSLSWMAISLLQITSSKISEPREG